MKRALTVVSLLAAALVFAQGRPAARDGGVAPSKAAPAPVDAGVAEPMRGPAPPSTAEYERLRKEVAELRTRTTELEQKAAKADALASDLDKLQKKLDALKGQVDAIEERRDNAEREIANRKAQTAQANATVNGVLQQLTTGNTANVEAWLRGAEQQYTGNAQKLVQLARNALGQGDLNATRQYLNLALIEAATPPAP